MKDAYYFPHDSNARGDPKIAALIQKFGLEGYGIWWALIEIMHEQGGKFQKFPKLYEGLAQIIFPNSKQNEATLEAEQTMSYKVKQIVNAAINEFFLFKEDENHIWSERVKKNIEFLENKRLQKVDAGRLGGIKSGEKRAKKSIKTKQIEAPLEANEANEAKERNVTERKVKEIIRTSAGKNVVKKTSELLNGMENLITGGNNPQPLVDLFVREGFDPTRVWATIVQARNAKNPAGFLVTALAEPRYAVSDEATECAKQEMLKFGY